MLRTQDLAIYKYLWCREESFPAWLESLSTFVLDIWFLFQPRTDFSGCILHSQSGHRQSEWRPWLVLKILIPTPQRFRHSPRRTKPPQLRETGFIGSPRTRNAWLDISCVNWLTEGWCDWTYSRNCRHTPCLKYSCFAITNHTSIFVCHSRYVFNN